MGQLVVSNKGPAKKKKFKFKQNGRDLAKRLIASA
jgi:hypothetical protein